MRGLCFSGPVCMGFRQIGVVMSRSGFACLGFAAWAFSLCTFVGQANEPTPKGGPPTFTKDVALILQQRCQGCHRRDQIGPFVLETYEQTRKRAADIAAVAEERSMPPWKPTAGVGPKLKHDRSLPAAEIAVLKAWAVAGAPRGEPQHMPSPARFPDGWTLGEPDLMLELAEDFKVPASGPDIYRCFVIPTDLPRDALISAVECRPGNRRVTHHILVYVDTHGYGRERDAAEPGPGYTSFSGPGVEISGDLGGWAAGNEAVHLPDGIGRSLPSRADVILQIHYHPDGKPEVDRTRLGIHFSRKPVKRTLQWANASNYDFRLSPGNRNVEVKATWYVPVDVEALAVTPHMHQLGRDFHMSVTYPNGHKQDLIHIADWDPTWQSTYSFEKPIRLPRGSIVKVLAHYDNSPHSRNPHTPPKLVKWGPEVTDEMCVGYIGVVKEGQDLTRTGEKDDLFEILAKQFQRNRLREQLNARRP
jgi:Copper type II ascorbate-dependent monooxygenase, C-terminal domain